MRWCKILKTSLKTWYGHYEFLVIFDKQIILSFYGFHTLILKQLLDKFVILFVDDIFIYSQNEDNHVDHLKIVLQSLKDHQLFC